LFGSATKEKTTHQAIGKYPTKGSPLNLATSLQYGTATGLRPLQDFLKEFTEKVSYIRRCVPWRDANVLEGL
jgi:aromatic amino acid aminotransferase I / 2-aminoadipate transaminase